MLAFLETCLPSLWSLILSSPCSSSDPSLSRCGAALAHLDSLPPHNLVIWTDGSVRLSFGKDGSGVIANCSLCGTETTRSFSLGPVCSSVSAEACAILQALRWFSRSTNKSATSLLLFSLCPLLRLFFYLKLLSPPLLSSYNGSLFLPLMSWSEGERYSCPCNPLLSLFSYLSYPLFSFL